MKLRQGTSVPMEFLLYFEKERMCMNAKSDVSVYLQVIRWLKAEKEKQLERSMFREATNTEKMIHAIEHKIRELSILWL